MAAFGRFIVCDCLDEYMPFRKWLRCPDCGGDDTGILAYRVAIVLECYECGNVEEFELGNDIPVHELDTEAIEATSTATDGGSDDD